MRTRAHIKKASIKNIKNLQNTGTERNVKSNSQQRKGKKNIRS